MNKSKLQTPKLIIASLILLVFTIGLTGCDPAEIAGFYNVTIEIEGLDEGVQDELRIEHNGEAVDQLQYDNGLFKATISNLRDDKTIRPVLSGEKFYTTESYSDRVTVNQEYNGRTIKFYATKKDNYGGDIQDVIDNSNPGDTIKIAADNQNLELEITTPGLTIKDANISGIDVNITKLKINANDVKVKNLNFDEGLIDILDSKKVLIKNINLTNNNDSSAIKINNSQLEVSESNISNNKTAIHLTNNSNLSLINNTINDNYEHGLFINDSEALIEGNNFGDNKNEDENSIAIKSNNSKVNIKNKNEIENNDIGISLNSSTSKINGNTFEVNSKAIKAENNSEIQFKNNELSNNTFGLYLLNTVSNIKYNNIRHSSNTGISIYGENSISESKINKNNFRYNDNAITALNNPEDREKVSSLDATENYWYTENIDEIKDLLKGFIEIEPISENEIPIDN